VLGVLVMSGGCEHGGGEAHWCADSYKAPRVCLWQSPAHVMMGCVGGDQ